MSAANLANVHIIDADGHVLDRDANLARSSPTLLPPPRLAFAERCLGFQHVWQA